MNKTATKWRSMPPHAIREEIKRLEKWCEACIKNIETHNQEIRCNFVDKDRHEKQIDELYLILAEQGGSTRYEEMVNGLSKDGFDELVDAIAKRSDNV
ncbi:MAG: hypothetical protein GY861_01265 [bacterium]|nr:hypothetical protein [bacterium]